VLWALSTRCHPAEDLDILRNTWSTGPDPSPYPPVAGELAVRAFLFVVAGFKRLSITSSALAGLAGSRTPHRERPWTA
jgi:hypothetical protein